MNFYFGARKVRSDFKCVLCFDFWQHINLFLLFQKKTSDNFGGIQLKFISRISMYLVRVTVTIDSKVN